MATNEKAVTDVPVPGVDEWEWGPGRLGHAGYHGTCKIGPFIFGVSAERQFSGSWQLHSSLSMSGVRVVTQKWEVDKLRCTPEGIRNEVAQQDALTRLVDSARKYLNDAVASLREFDATHAISDVSSGETTNTHHE